MIIFIKVQRELEKDFHIFKQYDTMPEREEVLQVVQSELPNYDDEYWRITYCEQTLAQ